MNAWQSIDWIASEALMHLEDSLVITNLTAKDKSADFNATPNGYSVGDTVRIKTRPEYEVRDFDSDAGAIVPQGIRESSRNMTIEKHFDVSVEVTAREKALDLESFSQQVIIPAAYALAEKCDQYVGTKILNGAGLYSSDTLFSTAADMALARKAATVQQLELDSRYCLVDLDLEAKLLGVDYFTTYNNRGETGATVFTNAQMGHAMGMSFFSSINFPSDATGVTQGDGASAGTDNGAGGNTNNRIGATTLTVDSTTGTFEIGDRIQIAGVRRPLIVAAQTAATATSIPLVDPITEVIPDNAAVSTISAGNAIIRQGAIFDGQSMAVAMPMLDPADDKPTSVTSNNGYSIRVVQGYDMASKKSTLSLDLLIGAEAYDPRRITMLADY
jgi:hypothetical protein